MESNVGCPQVEKNIFIVEIPPFPYKPFNLLNQAEFLNALQIVIIWKRTLKVLHRI
jgi:hypothetical protein